MFILKTTRKLETARYMASENDNAQPRAKRFSFKYCFYIDGVPTRVCKSYYLKTFSICDSRIYTAHKLYDNATRIPTIIERRGGSRRFLPEYQKMRVSNQIESFEPQESHYNRRNVIHVTYLPRHHSLERRFQYYLI